MVIIVDTCAILMLLRIAPEMFSDKRFGCTTIPAIHEELQRTQKFKTKYPWRNELMHHVKVCGFSDLKKNGFDTKVKQVYDICEYKRIYFLSRTDKLIIATLLCIDSMLCSGDGNLVSFAKEEFEKDNKSPLELVNNWLEKGLIEWNDVRQAVLAEWVEKERSQPLEQIKRFENLTRYLYPKAF